MRRILAVVFATALETAGEAITLLMTMSALALAVLAPFLHFHQFGLPERMAIDAGLSAQLVFGLFIAIFASIKALRREIESGTLQMALACAIPRTAFFCGKFIGIASILVFFSLILAFVTKTVAEGAIIGDAVARQIGDVPRLWGPSFTWGMTTLICPIVGSALLNYLFRFRFVLTANILIFLFALMGIFYAFDGALLGRVMAASSILLAPLLAFACAALAFSVQFADRLAAALSGLLLIPALPAFGSYYLSQVILKGHPPSLAYGVMAWGAALPFMLFFIILGCLLMKRRDVA